MYVLCISPVKKSYAVPEVSFDKVCYSPLFQIQINQKAADRLYENKIRMKLSIVTFFFRIQEKYPDSPAAQYASYAMEALKQTRHRLQVPSVEEIIAILECRSLVTTIYCYGGATCEIQINSATTAGQVGSLSNNCPINAGFLEQIVTIELTRVQSVLISVMTRNNAG